MKKIINGDLIKLAKNNTFDVIIQGCNCFCIMGAGFAKQIAYHFPEALAVDKSIIKGDTSKLGNYTYVHIPKFKLIIVNAYTQYGYGRNIVNVDYTAINCVFMQLKNQFAGKRFGFPKIGSGNAKGNWDYISNIIETLLYNEDITLVNYMKQKVT